MGNSKRKFEELEERYPDSLVMQLRGKFYCAYDKCAVVLSDIFDYKLKSTDTSSRCGFSIEAFDKVKDELDRLHINYVFVQNGKVLDEGKFKNNGFCDLYYGAEVCLADTNKEENDRGSACGKPMITQRTSIINGSGVNFEDAMIDIKKNIEKSILDNGFRVVSFSFITRNDVSNSSIVELRGIVVYE